MTRPPSPYEPKMPPRDDFALRVIAKQREALAKLSPGSPPAKASVQDPELIAAISVNGEPRGVVVKHSSESDTRSRYVFYIHSGSALSPDTDND